MAKLLCTLGQSVCIAPEAFYFLPDGFSEVHCFTSASDRIRTDLIHAFFAKRPEARYSVTRLEGFTNLATEDEHEHFEEGLWRWYLAHLEPGDLPYVCLAGGFKSMSASLQKAAHLFGAAQVFHILCDSNPATLEEVEQARRENRLRYISLGPESGWETLQQLREEHRLELAESDGSGDLRARATDRELSRKVREGMAALARKAAGWERAATMPFNGLALLSKEKQAWLAEPLCAETDKEWVRNLPKIELHCHLGGFATHGRLLEVVRASAEDPAEVWPPIPEPPEAWPLPREPVGLNPYRNLGDATGSALLRDRGCLRKQIELIYEHFLSENVVYAEVRCSPANYRSEIDSGWDVLRRIREEFDARMENARKAGGRFCHVNLIVIVTRRADGDLSDISRHLALAVTGSQERTRPGACRVVGVDLAGYESRETRARYFATDFDIAHRCGVAVTAHAGENDDVEGIWQAVFKLSARRIGHALHLKDSEDLMRTVAERGIGVEMCPYANVQIHGFAPVHPDRPVYPLMEYLKRDIKATVNTDNIGISQASLTENLLLLARLNPGISRMDLLRLQRNALDVAFASRDEKTELLLAFNEGIRV